MWIDFNKYCSTAVSVKVCHTVRCQISTQSQTRSVLQLAFMATKAIAPSLSLSLFV